MLQHNPSRTPNEISPELFETKYEGLPDGDYIGQAFILVSIVADPKSPNYGRREFQVEFTVIDGPDKSKIVSSSRVVLPHYLPNVPSTDYPNELKKWRGDVKNYFKQTDVMLVKFGIDTSIIDKTYIVKQIAMTNRLEPIVKFSVTNGAPRIINLISYQVDADIFSGLECIPDGNDAPLW